MFARKAKVDGHTFSNIIVNMTVLELKRQVARLNSRELKELHAHIVKLRHTTSEWRKTTARKLRAIQAGRLVTAEELEERIARG